MTKKPKDDVAKLLLDAAELLETKGWCQGGYAVGKSGRTVPTESRRAVAFCALGAIERVGLGKVDFALLGAAKSRLISRGLTVGLSIAAWNDQPGRTKKQVIAALRRAAR